MFKNNHRLSQIVTLPLVGFALFPVYPATAASSYFTTDTTINYALNGAAYIGIDAGGNRSTPTVRIVSGGSVSGLFTYSGSTVVVNGGQINNTPGAFNFSANETSAVTLTSGSINSPTRFTGSSSLSVTGGSMTSTVSATQSSNVTVSGGTFTRGGATANFYDGTTGAFTFVGSGLGATLTGLDGSGGQYYALTGTLLDGNSLSGDVIDVAGGATMFSLVAAPEPSQIAGFSLGALGLAGMGLRRRKRF